MKIRLTKLKEAPNPLTPNNIAEGFVKEVETDYFEEPKVGERFWVGLNYSTSGVQEIIDSNTFRTYNSIYKYEILDK